jgi:predicted anti-sigma-YlaC factor YlaD
MSTDVEQLSCQELVELVTEYLEGAMTPEDRARFDDHLAACGNCRDYLDQMRTTIRLTGSLTPAAMSAEAERELLDAFRNWRRS